MIQESFSARMDFALDLEWGHFKMTEHMSKGTEAGKQRMSLENSSNSLKLEPM